MTERRGSTLIELIVTLTIMAVLAAVATLALRGTAEPPGEVSQLSAARRLSIRTRTPVTVSFVDNGVAESVTFFPDGSAIADSVLRVDRLTGTGYARP